MTKKEYLTITVLRILYFYPFIWFDNQTMALTVNCNRKTIGRIKKKLLNHNLLETKGRYFRSRNLHKK